MITRRGILSLIPAMAALVVVPTRTSREPEAECVVTCGCKFYADGGIYCRDHAPIGIIGDSSSEVVIPMKSGFVVQEQMAGVVGINWDVVRADGSRVGGFRSVS